MPPIIIDASGTLTAFVGCTRESCTFYHFRLSIFPLTIVYAFTPASLTHPLAPFYCSVHLRLISSPNACLQGHYSARLTERIASSTDYFFRVLLLICVFNLCVALTAAARDYLPIITKILIPYVASLSSIVAVVLTSALIHFFSHPLLPV